MDEQQKDALLCEQTLHALIAQKDELDLWHFACIVFHLTTIRVIHKLRVPMSSSRRYERERHEYHERRRHSERYRESRQ